MMVIGLLAVAVVGLVVMNRRSQLRAGLVIAGLCLLGAGSLALTASRVTTDRELIASGTRRLIAAATMGDSKTVGEILSSDARLTLAGAGSFSLDREELLAGVEALNDKVGLDGHRILDLTESVDGPNVGRSRVVVRVNLKEGGLAFSSWEMLWRREGDTRWRLMRMECLSVNGQTPGDWFAGELTQMTR